MYPSIQPKGFTSSYLVRVNKDCVITCHNLGTAKYYLRLAKRGKDLTHLCDSQTIRVSA